jgi:hypothetical protein
MSAWDHIINSIDHRVFEKLAVAQLSSVLPSSYELRCSITVFLSVSYINMFSTRMAIGRFKTMQIVPVLSQMDLIPLKSASLIRVLRTLFVP